MASCRERFSRVEEEAGSNQHPESCSREHCRKERWKEDGGWRSARKSEEKKRFKRQLRRRREHCARGRDCRRIKREGKRTLAQQLKATITTAWKLPSIKLGWHFRPHYPRHRATFVLSLSVGKALYPCAVSSAPESREEEQVDQSRLMIRRLLATDPRSAWIKRRGAIAGFALETF